MDRGMENKKRLPLEPYILSVIKDDSNVLNVKS